MLCCAVVHAADLSNVSRPWTLAGKWAALHAEEQWRQGDTEKTLGVTVSPMCERQVSPTEITQAIGAMQVSVLSLSLSIGAMQVSSLRCIHTK